MLEFLPLGQDYNAGMYRVLSEQTTAYIDMPETQPLGTEGGLLFAHSIPGATKRYPTPGSVNK